VTLSCSTPPTATADQISAAADEFLASAGDDMAEKMYLDLLADDLQQSLLPQLSIARMDPHSPIFCLRWNNHRNNLLNVLDQLLQTESFCDVTLACDGASVKCHKMILSACSSYFQQLFLEQ
jgi:hypothetical protein